MEKGIDYKKIGDAQDFYTKNGFEYIDLPWSVDEEFSNITKPIDAKNFPLNDKFLVASGEQSFLELSLKNNLKKGRYCGITPCFRDESILDRLHNDYFLKLELFQSVDVDNWNLVKMIHLATDYFSMYLYVESSVVKTDEGYDIVTSTGIELGSYGIRTYNDFSWIYGTGCAEPRLSRSI